ncbi:MAG: hypothetical protein M3M94_00415, partial [Actinomycetota bacterium]|nr:hypothetical protein [Actinomycetota bacterium]
EAGVDGAPADAATGDGLDAEKPKKRTRRGSRGGRNRRKKPVSAGEETPEGEPVERAGEGREGDSPAGDATSDGAAEWEYVPMDVWADEIDGRDSVSRSRT